MSVCVWGSGIWARNMGDSPTPPMDHLKITFSIDHRNADESMSWNADMSQCQKVLLNVDQSNRHHVHFTLRYLGSGRTGNWVCKEVRSTPLGERFRPQGETDSTHQPASDSSQ